MRKMNGLVCALLVCSVVGALASSNLEAGEGQEAKGHYLRGTKPEMVEAEKFKFCEPPPVNYPPPYVYPSPDYSPPYSPSPDYSPHSPVSDYSPPYSPAPDYKPPPYSPKPEYKSPSPPYKSAASYASPSPPS